MALALGAEQTSRGSRAEQGSRREPACFFSLLLYVGIAAAGASFCKAAIFCFLQLQHTLQYFLAGG